MDTTTPTLARISGHQLGLVEAKADSARDAVISARISAQVRLSEVKAPEVERLLAALNAAEEILDVVVMGVEKPAALGLGEDGESNSDSLVEQLRSAAHDARYAARRAAGDR